jgi:DUF4097 and DUF4098 domain-containing protein YvlB
MRRETFATPTPPRLRLRVPAGSIDVVTADGDETMVELEPRSGDAASETVVEEARIELADRRGKPELVVKVDDKPRASFLGINIFGSGPEVTLTVRAPHGAELVVESAAADIEATGEFASAEVDAASGDIRIDHVIGDLEVNAASGDVQAGQVGGDARINTASGDVRLRQVDGRAEIRTASGDVELRLAGNGVKVRSASGDQEIGAVAEGEVSLQSASGDVSVGICQGSRLWVDAGSASGDATSELELEAGPGDEDGPLVELRAATMSGDVRVVRAPAREQLTR